MLQLFRKAVWQCVKKTNTYYQTRLVLPDARQAKVPRYRGLKQRENLFTRQPSEETKEQISNPPPGRQGA